MTGTIASPLTVAGAVLDGETVGVRCEDGRIAALGPGVGPEPGDEGIEAGGLRVGGPADFLLLRGDAPELSLGDLYSDLVYAANGSVVDTTVVGGRVLMRGGELPGLDGIVARAVERSRRLGIG